MALNANFRTDLESQIAKLKADRVYKTLNHLESPQAAHVRMEGRGNVLVLSSNNYLGLCDEPTVVHAGIQGLETLFASTPKTAADRPQVARRLAERGVRFLELIDVGSSANWDSHGNMADHERLAKAIDQPIAALLGDLKQRGLLEDTLVVWGGEFGRTPVSENGNGRDHNPYGFTMVMAGAGIRGGRAYGTSDDLGLHAVEDRLHVHDLHATWLHLLGADHMKTVFKHKGRPERPTLNEGEPYLKLVTG